MRLCERCMRPFPELEHDPVLVVVLAVSWLCLPMLPSDHLCAKNLKQKSLNANLNICSLQAEKPKNVNGVGGNSRLHGVCVLCVCVFIWARSLYYAALELWTERGCLLVSAPLLYRERTHSGSITFSLSYTQSEGGGRPKPSFLLPQPIGGCAVDEHLRPNELYPEIQHQCVCLCGY